MPNPAQALAEAAKAIRFKLDEWSEIDADGVNLIDAFDAALAAFDSWRPWEDEAVVERAAQALAEDEMRGVPAWRWDWDAEKAAWRAVARMALKAALGGDDA